MRSELSLVVRSQAVHPLAFPTQWHLPALIIISQTPTPSFHALKSRLAYVFASFPLNERAWGPAGTHALRQRIGLLIQIRSAIQVLCTSDLASERDLPCE